MKSSPVRRGFTLIEILVVAAIMAVLFGVGIAAYARFDRKRKIETSAMEFASYLRKTQKRADSGDMALQCSGTLEGIRVTVDLLLSPTKATDTLDCPNPPSSGIYSTQTGVHFSDDFSVTFMTIGRGVTLVDETTILSDSFNTATYQIGVTSGGAITVQDIP